VAAEDKKKKEGADITGEGERTGFGRQAGRGRNHRVKEAVKILPASQEASAYSGKLKSGQG